jgi:hypothetical protein
MLTMCTFSWATCSGLQTLPSGAVTARARLRNSLDTSTLSKQASNNNNTQPQASLHARVVDVLFLSVEPQAIMVEGGGHSARRRGLQLV